ncbi:MAG: hypothetical protein ACO4AU_13495 [bacterium]|jgi:hypothetical protein
MSEEKSAKVISLAEYRAKREQEAAQAPIPGWLVWLSCPQCGTVEYTEVRLPEGRYHKCGTLVDEAEVPIDIRAEITISRRNLQLLQEVFESGTASKLLGRLLRSARDNLEQLQQSEETYQNKLLLMAGQDVESYPEEWDPAEAGLRFEVIQPPGLKITEARQPQLHLDNSNEPA